MSANLVPEHALSQVVFVHDYVQLIFQHASFNLYNTIRVSGPSGAFVQGQTGFADALVGLIGQRVRSEQDSSECILELVFEEGTRVQLLRGDEYAHITEAFEFFSEDGSHFLELND
jgi:hypothetical protein